MFLSIFEAQYLADTLDAHSRSAILKPIANLLCRSRDQDFVNIMNWNVFTFVFGFDRYSFFLLAAHSL